MTLRKLMMALALPVMALSCGGRMMHISDVTIQDSLMFADGKPYSGDIWSDDEHMYQLTTQDGVLVECRLYHDNDSVAIEFLNDSTVTFYDDEGTVLPEDSFKVRYKDVSEALAELMSIIN